MEGVAPLPGAAMPATAVQATATSPRPLWRRAAGRAARALGLR